MKLLLVDDDPRRYRRLMDRLAEAGVSREDVQFATSANDARDLLETEQFDLMVVDIILPLRPEDEPQERHSIDLINELIDFGNLKRPRQIVGLSAFDPAAVSARPFFAERLWTVVQYSDSNDDWIAQINNCINYIIGTSESQIRECLDADIVIICALDNPELRAVLELPWNWQPSRPIDDITFVHEGTVQLSGNSYKIIAAVATRMGMVQAALLTSKLVDRVKPRLVVMTGICAGLPGKTNIGDVLLADPVWDWQSGKRMKEAGEPKFSISPHQIAVDSAVRSRFEQLRADRQAFALIAAGRNEATVLPKLVIGPVVSGSAVLADGTIANNIREQHRDLCGIEMEAYGVYSAVLMTCAPRPLVFSIKAVCDYADDKKSDNSQAFAAYMSAETLRLFIVRFGEQIFKPTASATD